MTVTVVRGELEESRHGVHVAVVDRDGRLVAWHGDPHRLTTMRSGAKPFQAQPLVASGAVEALGLDSETLAVCCASHAGRDEHVAAVRRGLEACGLGPEALRNSNGTPEERLRHNCSGNHLAFLALSVHRGWDLPSYRDPPIPPSRRRLGRWPAPPAFPRPRSPPAPTDAESSASPCRLPPSPPCTRGYRSCCRASTRPCAATPG